MDTDKKHLFEALFDSSGGLDEHADLNAISEKIIGSAFTVGNSLGCGFLEKVYENALAHELSKQGIEVGQRQEIRVIYDNVEVGKYEADLVVQGKIIVELKAVRDLNEIHRAQCMNYLRATGFRLCLLINFGNPRVEVKRIVL